MGSVPGTAQMDGRKVLREAPTPGPTRGTRVEGDKSRVFSSLVVCSGTDSCGRGSRGRSLLEAFAGWSVQKSGRLGVPSGAIMYEDGAGESDWMRKRKRTGGERREEGRKGQVLGRQHVWA